MRSIMGAMIVPDRRIRFAGMGQPPGHSHIHVRTIDRSGTPLSGLKFAIVGPAGIIGEGETNGDGFGIVELPVPVGQIVTVNVTLPEGDVTRKNVETVFHISGQVELFQSVTVKPETPITLSEALAFGAGLVLTGVGFAMKDGKAEELFIGLGSGFAAIAGFSLVFRHLR